MTMRLAGASPPLLRTGKQYVLVPTMSMAEEGLRFFPEQCFSYPDPAGRAHDNPQTT